MKCRPAGPLRPSAALFGSNSGLVSSVIGFKKRLLTALKPRQVTLINFVNIYLFWHENGNEKKLNKSHKKKQLVVNKITKW